MIITRVRLQNWKNFQAIDVPLQPRTFLVGANASGKSNFLDAIRFLRDIARPAGGLQYAVSAREGVAKLRCLAARAQSDIEIEVHLADGVGGELRWKYVLGFKHIGGGIQKSETQITKERVWDAQKCGWVVDRTPQDEANDQEALKFTYLEQITSNKPFREVYTFFNEVQYLHVVPQLLRDADSYMLASHREDFYGRNLLERMAKTNKNTRDAYLRRIGQALKLAVPQLSNLEFIVDKKTGVPHLEARYEHWRAKGGKQRETQFSDGTLRIIGFLWALMDGNETVLLEEPELNLHAAIVKQLAEFISRVQHRRGRVRQVIMTTHSYDLLSNEGIGGDEVLILEPSAEGTTIRPADEVGEVKAMLEAGFSVAEAALPKVAPGAVDGFNQLSRS